MKKIIITATLILTTGVLSSQIKVNNVQTEQPRLANAPLSNDSKELASGD